MIHRLIRWAVQNRLVVFLLVSTALAWTIRRLAKERAALSNQELQRQLILADAERRLAEERAAASEALRDREAMLQIALKANGMALWVWDIKQNRSTGPMRCTAWRGRNRD